MLLSTERAGILTILIKVELMANIVKNRICFYEAFIIECIATSKMIEKYVEGQILTLLETCNIFTKNLSL